MEEYQEEPISVIVAARDEEQNIALLINDLIAQTHTNFELIIVDDHSSDSTPQMVEEYAQMFSFIRLYKSDGQGKKSALKLGIQKAQFDFVVVTDADCRVSSNWLQTMVCFYKQKGVDLIFGPVRFSFSASIFSQFQSLEFLSLTASSAGSIGAGMPILSNACNMAFTKKCWNDCVSDIEEKSLSGDDMFLMISAKKQHKRIAFLKSPFAIVDTSACNSLSQFFNQRKRWSSKSKYYADLQVIIAGLIVALMSVNLVVLFVLSWICNAYFNVFFVCFGLKFVIDLLFLLLVSPFYQQERLLKWYVPLTLLYPFYVSVSLVGGLLENFTWKGRHV